MDGRSYWVVSHTVDRDAAPVQHYIELILHLRAALMGWEGDTRLGSQFAMIPERDVILIARGRGETKKILALGVANGEVSPPVDQTYGQHRLLKPFIDLRIGGREVTPAQFGLDFATSRLGMTAVPPALYKLNPDEPADKPIIAWIDARLETQEMIDTVTSPRAVLELFHQVVLQGPPGTGKTYAAMQLAQEVLALPASEWPLRQFSCNQEKGCWELVQFHPAYNYEDFMRGIEVVPDNGHTTFRPRNRIFLELAEAARRNPDQKYVLIIDEINRANLPAVMGELLYALEYRGERVFLPHTMTGLTSLALPPTLLIIGTMNTADRSIGYLDYAVRRRFAFVPCPPRREVLEQFDFGADAALQRAALQLYDAVSKLFTPPEQGGSHLSPDFDARDVAIGHTYFMAKSRTQLSQKFLYQAYPLLREYERDGILVPASGQPVRITIGNSESVVLRASDAETKLLAAIGSLF